MDVQRSPSDSCLMQRFALYDYAATYLRYHMNHIEPEDDAWSQYASMTKHYAAFHAAVRPAHSSHVNTLGLTAPCYYAETPLRHAIRLHGSAPIRTFATSSYNLNEKVYDYVGSFIVEAETALHHYIKQHEVVAELLNCGSSPNVGDYVQRTALHVAVLRGSRATVKLLLSSTMVDVNAQDVEGRTALHYEATSGRGSLLLNDPRVDVDLRDKNGRTAITSAASWGDHQTTVGFLRSRRNVMAQHDGELSLLIAAAQQNWLDITLEVLSHLPDASNHRGYDGKTILHLAVTNDWEDVLVRAITQAHVKVNDVDSAMRTPLHEAAEIGNFRLARKLIAHGASARCRDSQGQTPIQLAAIAGFSDTVLALLNSDFNINDADKQQRTLVHWAATWDWTMIMGRVTEYPEANLLKHDSMGRTALHIAALCGCPNVLAYLINEDIFDVNETDCFGNTLLHLAARGRSKSAVDVTLNASRSQLRRPFTQVHAVNNYGQTALDVAVAYGAEDVIKHLRKIPLSEQKVIDWEARNKAYYLRRPPDLVHDFTGQWQVVVFEASHMRPPSREQSPSLALDDFNCREELPTRAETPVRENRHRRRARTPSPYHDIESEARRRAPVYAPESTRPSYTRCAIEHITPQALDEHGIPWDWDSMDVRYIIIKINVSPELLDDLCRHTRRLRGLPKRRRS